MFLLKNVVGSDLRVQTTKEFVNENSGRKLPPPRGDLIGETLNGTPGYLYYAVSTYSWYDPKTFRAHRRRASFKNQSRCAPGEKPLRAHAHQSRCPDLTLRASATVRLFLFTPYLPPRRRRYAEERRKTRRFPKYERYTKVDLWRVISYICGSVVAPTLLEVKQLGCVRGDRRLFSRLDLSLPAGTYLQVTGPNGSGKTSLLRILCGLLAPAEGEINWQGENIRSLAEDYFTSVTYLGHRHNVKDELSAIENLRISNALTGIVISKERAREVLTRIGLAGRE